MSTTQYPQDIKSPLGPGLQEWDEPAQEANLATSTDSLNGKTNTKTNRWTNLWTNHWTKVVYLCLGALVMVPLLPRISHYTPCAKKLNPFAHNNRGAEDPLVHIMRPDPIWTPCGGKDFYCSNLSLPLDYDNREVGNFSLAIAKYSSPLVRPEEKLGTLMFNPGGPGLSGVETLFLIGEKLSAIVDHKYDILGFDPRGVGNSMPIRCFNENDLIDDIIDFPLISDCSTGPGKVLKNKEAYSHACALKESEAKYITTPLVATDMLYIAKHMGQEKVNYWGFSYGSVIGNTFAQLYPENMGRMIVDGIVDVEDYYSGQHLNALRSIDELQSKFFEECVASGSCPFEDDDAELIEADVLRLLENLRTEPYVVTRPASVSELNEQGEVRPTYVTVNHLWVLDRLFGAMYTPDIWKSTAELFQALLSGENDELIYNAFSWRTLSNIGERYRDNGGYLTLCGDSVGGELNRLDREVDVGDLYQHYRDMQKSSSELYSSIWLVNVCVNSRVKPVWQMDPFKPVNGSMLVISNTYDPVTPIDSGRKTVDFYSEGSLLVQDGYGHTSLAQKSSCTAEAIRAWLVDGVLPESGTVCKPDAHPFDASTLAIGKGLSKNIPHRDNLLAPYVLNY